MEDIGVVVRLKDKYAVVEIEPRSFCSSCKHKTVCSISPEGEKRQVNALNFINAQPGDTVRIEMDPKNTILSAFLIFIFPVIGLFIGYFSGEWLGKGHGVWGAVVGLICFFLLVRLFDYMLGRRAKFQPTITTVLK